MPKKTPPKLKTFRVGFWYTEGGYINVEAESAKEAEEAVEERMNEEGLEGILTDATYECTNREWQTIDVK